jgi:hypothetical protein
MKRFSLNIYTSYSSRTLITILFTLLILTNSTVFSKSYFISSTGSDANDGTINSPFLTISFAITKAVAGDTLFIRGGTYKLNTTIRIQKSGTADARLYLFGYQDERALLDFSSMAFSSSNRGINLSANYWHIKGLDIKGAGDNGMIISGGSNNIIEFCSFFENRDTGLQLASGASNNNIINCDSYFNADPNHGNADGFAPKLDVGTNNYFYGCRAWQNSDDGWDGYMRGANDVSTIIENSWCFSNGYLKSGSPSSGNGNGFKMGGSDDKMLMHNMTLKNCLAFDNRVKGYDQNNNRGSMIIHNSSAYRNGTNFSIMLAPNTGKVVSIINNAVIGFGVALGTFAEQKTNSWMMVPAVTESDFESIDTTGVRGPRKPDGSLPDLKFLKLSAGSRLIDAGTDVGLPFTGQAPDLGAFEYQAPTNIIEKEKLPTAFSLLQNYPNPFNPETTISYELSSVSNVTLKIFDIVGNEIATLVNSTQQAGIYNVKFSINSSGSHSTLTRQLRANSSLSSAVYFYKLQVDNHTLVKKMILMK